MRPFPDRIESVNSAAERSEAHNIPPFYPGCRALIWMSGLGHLARIWSFSQLCGCAEGTAFAGTTDFGSFDLPDSPLSLRARAGWVCDIHRHARASRCLCFSRRSALPFRLDLPLLNNKLYIAIPNPPDGVRIYLGNGGPSLSGDSSRHRSDRGACQNGSRPHFLSRRAGEYPDVLRESSCDAPAKSPENVSVYKLLLKIYA